MNSRSAPWKPSSGRPSPSCQAAKLGLTSLTPLTGRQGGTCRRGARPQPWRRCQGPVNGRRMARRRETGREDGHAGRHSASSPHPGALAARVRSCRRRVGLPDETREEGKRYSSLPHVRGCSYKGPCPPVAASPSSLLSFTTPIVHLRTSTTTPRIPTPQSFQRPTDHHHVYPQRAPPLQGARVGPGPAVGHLAVRVLLALQHVPGRLLRAVRDVRQDAPPRAQQRRSRRVLVLQRVGMFLAYPRGVHVLMDVYG